MTLEYTDGDQLNHMHKVAPSCQPHLKPESTLCSGNRTTQAKLDIAMQGPHNFQRISDFLLFALGEKTRICGHAIKIFVSFTQGTPYA